MGSHAFLDEFALAYHRAVADRLRAEPEAVLERALCPKFCIEPL